MKVVLYCFKEILVAILGSVVWLCRPTENARYAVHSITSGREAGCRNGPLWTVCIWTQVELNMFQDVLAYPMAGGGEREKARTRESRDSKAGPGCDRQERHNFFSLLCTNSLCRVVTHSLSSSLFLSLSLFPSPLSLPLFLSLSLPLFLFFLPLLPSPLSFVYFSATALVHSNV